MTLEIDGEELRKAVGRIEYLEAEIRNLNQRKKMTLAQAKRVGLVPRLVKKAVARRRLGPEKIKAENAVLRAYMDLVGYDRIDTGNVVPMKKEKTAA